MERSEKLDLPIPRKPASSGMPSSGPQGSLDLDGHPETPRLRRSWGPGSNAHRVVQGLRKDRGVGPAQEEIAERRRQAVHRTCGARICAADLGDVSISRTLSTRTWKNSRFFFFLSG